MSIRILLVEDDGHVCNTVGASLAEAGYQVDVCTDGNEACIRFYENAYQLVALDIMLLGMNGHELLCEFRAKNDTPVLMMTTPSGDENQIRVFDVEVDDYTTRPLKMQILLKQVEALLRRSGALAKGIRASRSTPLSRDSMMLCDGTELPLTRKEFEILLPLVQNKGRTLAYEIILSCIWEYDFEGDGSTVHTYIKNLRAKLSEDIIKAIHGVGYRLEEL